MRRLTGPCHHAVGYSGNGVSCSWDLGMGSLPCSLLLFPQPIMRGLGRLHNGFAALLLSVKQGSSGGGHYFPSPSLLSSQYLLGSMAEYRFFSLRIAALIAALGLLLVLGGPLQDYVKDDYSRLSRFSSLIPAVNHVGLEVMPRFRA